MSKKIERNILKSIMGELATTTETLKPYVLERIVKKDEDIVVIPTKPKKEKKKKNKKKVKKHNTKLALESYILTRRVRTRYSSIIIDRIKERCANEEIPRVDDMITSTVPISHDYLETYYRKNKIYPRLTIIPFGQNKTPTNQIHFDFDDLRIKHKKPKRDVSTEKLLAKIDHAEIGKKSFMNNITTILRYINYFIEYFDDDDELIMGYLQMMFTIMEKNIELTPDMFVELLYATFTTPSLIEKVACMVEYNVDPSMIKKPDKIYDESIQLTLDHLKAIIGVSCLHKFIIPIVCQYVAVKSNVIKKNSWSEKELYYQAFLSFMSAFDETYDVNLYNKLYHTATTRITKTNQDLTMWKRRENFGTTPTLFTHNMIHDYMIDSSQKIICNSSGISFIHVCFDWSIRNEIFQKDKFTFTEMTMEASDSVNEHFSKFDKYQIDKSFHSQRDRIRGFVSIQDMISTLGKQFGIDFYKMVSRDPKCIKETEKLREEYNFYKTYIPMPLNESQLFIIQLYFGSKMGNMEDVGMIELNDIIKIIMIMKRDFMLRNFVDLRFFISSVIDTTSNRKYNVKKIEKLFNMNPCYEDWKDEYGDNLSLFNMKKFYDIIKVIISCPMHIVDYEYDHYWSKDENGDAVYHGKKTKLTDACIIDEILRLLLGI